MQHKNLLSGQKKMVYLGFVSLSLLTGCNGTVRDRSNDYVHTQAGQAVRVPADLHHEPFSQEYDIP